MIQEYLYEIIAIIVILTSLVIYFLIVRFKQEAQNDFDFPDKANLKQIVPKRNRRGIVAKNIIEDKNDKDNKDEAFIIKGTDEKNFGSIYIPVEDDIVDNSSIEEVEEKKEIEEKKKKEKKRNKKKKVVIDAELNIKLGLSSCNDDIDFYKDVLKAFSKKYSNSPKELSTLLENTDTQIAQDMLFELIGITSYIGAENVKSILNDLSEATKDSQEKNYTPLMDKYEKHLDILLKDIENYL
ncbi:hypothetical protein [Sulfurimonas sp.]